MSIDAYSFDDLNDHHRHVVLLWCGLGKLAQFIAKQIDDFFGGLRLMFAHELEYSRFAKQFVSGGHCLHDPVGQK